MGKKYITPRVNVLSSEMKSELLAGSNPSAGNEFGGGNENGGGGGNTGSGEGGWSEAKENTFSTWEDWDEY